MQHKTQVLLLHNIVAPYRLPLFRALAAHPEIDLTVWFLSQTARNRRWNEGTKELGFRHDVLPRVEVSYFSRDLFTYIVNPSFPWRYARGGFDVLISAGWLDFASQAGFVLSKALGRKFVLWSESTANEPSWRRTAAQPVVGTMVKGSDACIAVGTRSREYLVSLGASPSKVFTAFSTVDVNHFRSVSNEARRCRPSLKMRLGIRRNKVILFSGQFIERKGLRYLIEAFSIVKAKQPDVALVLLGYGPLKEALAEQVRHAGLEDVHFVNHVDVAEIPGIYAAADVLVLPSLEETWGLVVNEAMACGLPVIATDRVGSSVDLIEDGVNGYVVLARDAPVLADRLLRLLTDNALLNRFSEQSSRVIENFTPERAADGFAAAVAHACQARCRAREKPLPSGGARDGR